VSKELTDKEARFVEFYCTDANGVATEAARMAGYTSESARGAGKLLKKEHIARAIDAWRENRARRFRIAPNQILERMWEEANFFGDGATHAGRINALVNLGKQMGLFEQKKLDQAKNVGNTYNIINYSDADPMTKKVTEAIKTKEKEVVEALEHQQDIEVLDYNNFDS
jgi:phage terminase small subunit